MPLQTFGEAFLFFRKLLAVCNVIRRITHVNQHSFMKNSLAAFSLLLLLGGTALAQQQPRRAGGNKTTTAGAGTTSSTDVTRSNASTASGHEGTEGVTTGTGLTNDQRQTEGSGTNRTTKVDANSSIRTGASAVKAKKKSVKYRN